MAIDVNLGDANGQVSSNIYGQFIEHALDCIEGGIYAPGSVYADDDGIRKDVVGLVQRFAPSVLRFPGGTIMCQYHWKDAVGAKENRVFDLGWRVKPGVWNGGVYQAVPQDRS